jgi:hypothetical protein
MARPLWFINLIKKTYPSRFRAAKLTRLPLIGRIVEYGLFEGDDIIYLPRDNVIRVDQPIEGSGNTVLPSQVVEHFIEQASYHWIMDACICRDGSYCEDYPIDFGCLFLGEAVLQINPQLGRRVTKLEALEHVQRCREAGRASRSQAVDHLQLLPLLLSVEDHPAGPPFDWRQGHQDAGRYRHRDRPMRGLWNLYARCLLCGCHSTGW